MSGETVVVIHLLPVDADDEFGFRILTLKSDSDTLEIGRASKRESKNLFPRADNALFDSRVMSRSHAKVRVVFDRKEVFLRDGASTHGTYLNGEKLLIGKDYTIVNGDLVAFGTEVIRGRDSFPPLRFRFEYRWMETSAESIPSATRVKDQPTNTFCVPDNDDDSDEIEVDVDGAPSVDSGPESDNSGLYSDSEDMSVVEVPSPFSGSSKFCKHELTGTQHSPIDLDSEQERQPLVTPRMTPPSNRNITATSENSKDMNNEIRHLDQRMVPPPNQELPAEELIEVAASQYEVESEGDSYEPSESSYSEESVSESEDSEGEPTSQFEAAIDVEPEASHLTSLQREYSARGINDQQLAHDEFDSNSNPYTAYSAPTSMEVMPAPERPVPQEDSLESLALPDATPDKRATSSSLHLPSPSQLLGHSLDVFRPTSLSSMTTASSHLHGFRPCPTSTSFPPPPWRGCESSSVYTDGPFVNDQASYVAPRDVTKGPAMVGGHESACEQPVPPVNTIAPTYPNISSSSDPKPSLKRKAEEIDNSAISWPESWGKEPDEASDNEEASIPDAQPQDLLQVVDESQPESQVSDGMQSVKEVMPVDGVQDATPLVERPAKRPRTSGPSNLRIHATTAVVGAVVGAVGTIALLASLPQDYFL